MKFLLNFLVLTVLVVCLKGQDYDHGDQSKWYEYPNGECHRNSQSPIELDSEKAIKAFGCLQFNNYDIPFTAPATLQNNGHTADIQLPANSAFVTGLPLSYSKYALESLHFHWGSQDHHGAEHVINGVRYALELHLVHRNTKYATVDEATQHADGLVVLAVFFEVNPDQQDDFVGLTPIVSVLSEISDYESSIDLNNLVVPDILNGTDTNKFFRYPGSLTTPPCSEAVTWIVFPGAIAIPSRQIAAYRSLLDIDRKPLVNNYRCLQAINGRKIYLFN